MPTLSERNKNGFRADIGGPCASFSSAACVSCPNRHLVMCSFLKEYALFFKNALATRAGTMGNWKGHNIRGSGAIGKSIVSLLVRY